MMIKINKTLADSINDYCELNSLDVEEFTNRILKIALTQEKYGKKPTIKLKFKGELKPKEEEPIVDDEAAIEEEKVIKPVEKVIEKEVEPIDEINPPKKKESFIEQVKNINRKKDFYGE